jgi:hypothetical protein
MAIFKPAVTGNGTTDGPSKYLGIQPISIFEFKDRSGEYEWADLFLSVTVRMDISEYDRFIEIKGSLEKGPDGLITGGSVLNRLYKFFEAIGCTAGLNTDGTWEDSEGNTITDIATYLNERFVNGNPVDAKYDHVAYMYKRQGKPGGKAYTTCHYRIYPNDANGKANLTEHVAWMKSKEYIKEAVVSNTTNNVPTDGVPFNL